MAASEFPLGVHQGVSNADYQADPAISKSQLDVVARTPLHYWQAYVNPEREPREATPAMMIGTLIHSAVLEPDTLNSAYAVLPENAPTRPTDRQRNAAKPSPETLLAVEWWDAWERNLAGRTQITAEQWKVAMGVRDSVFKHPAAASLLRGLGADGRGDTLGVGRPEVSYFGLDPEFGVRVKARADWLHPGSFILDVKSTEDASPDGFVRSVLKWRYHVQQSWYQDVIAAATDGEPPKDWYFLAVEKSPPYACGVYTLPPDIVRAGRALARRDLQRLVEARSLDFWPGYPQAPTELVFPGWAAEKAGANSPEAEFA